MTQIGQPSEWSIPVVVSIGGLLLGIVGLTLNRLTERDRRREQVRKDKLDCEKHLDSAHEILFRSPMDDASDARAAEQKVESLIRKARLLNPDSASAVRYLGYFHLFCSGNVELAKEQLVLALELDDNDARTYNALGLVSSGAEAIVSFEKAIRLDSAFGWAHQNLARELLKQGDVNSAGVHFLRATEIEPKNADHLVALARHLRNSGRDAEALAAFERAIQCDPQSVDALAGLGKMLAFNGSVERGLELLEDAIRTRPQDWYPYAEAADAHEVQGNLDKALELRRKAAELNPSRRLPSAPPPEVHREANERGRLQ